RPAEVEPERAERQVEARAHPRDVAHPARRQRPVADPGHEVLAPDVGRPGPDIPRVHEHLQPERTDQRDAQLRIGLDDRETSRGWNLVLVVSAQRADPADTKSVPERDASHLRIDPWRERGHPPEGLDGAGPDPGGQDPAFTRGCLPGGSELELGEAARSLSRAAGHVGGGALGRAMPRIERVITRVAVATELEAMRGVIPRHQDRERL